MVNPILIDSAYQIHERLETVDFNFMSHHHGSLSNTCPACEFDQDHKGVAVAKNGAMECLSCGTSWKVIEAAPTKATEKPKRASEQSHFQPANSALVDNRIFNKRHFDTSNAKTSAPDQSPKTSSFSMIAAVAVLLVSAGLFLQTWIWLNPQSNKITLSKVEVETLRSQSGKQVYRVKGLVLNNSTRSKHVPQIAIILKASDGTPLVHWVHNSPSRRLEPNGKKQFASTIIHESANVAYAEARLFE